MEIIVGMRTQLLGQLRATGDVRRRAAFMYTSISFVRLLHRAAFALAGFVRARGGGDIRDVNLNSENWAVVKAVLVAGMYPNLMHVNRDNLTLMGSREKKVRFHPTSILSQPQYKKVSDPLNPLLSCVPSILNSSSVKLRFLQPTVRAQRWNPCPPIG